MAFGANRGAWRARNIGELQLDGWGVHVDHESGVRRKQDDRVDAARREK